MLPQKSERCCFIEDDDNPCVVMPTGASLLYSEKHKKDVQKQSKASNNSKHAKNYRLAHKRDYEYHHKNQLRRLHNYYGLTNRQLSAPDRIAFDQTLRDLWPSAKDDQHDFARRRLEDIKRPFLYKSLPLPEVIDDALSEVGALSEQLAKRHPKSVHTRFIHSMSRKHR
jgi:hypothetical protein